MIKNPDFYLSSTESDELRPARSCWIKGRLTVGVRDDSLLIQVDPPLIGQQYGLGEEDITELILMPRLEGSSLFPVNEWPLHVYIYRALKKEVESGDTLAEDKVREITWGAIYPTKEAADSI